MSTKSIANAVGGKTARACDSCVKKRARWYCAADDAFLCQTCDSAVHSANPLARRHQRLRLNSASSTKPPSPPPWLSGFTRKPRTPRRRPKYSDEDFLSLVPDADEENDQEDHNLLFRVPNFDDPPPPSFDAISFLPSDLDLGDFAADVDTLLGRNLENECFALEGIGFGIDDKIKHDHDISTSGTAAVKMEEHNCRVVIQPEFDAGVDLMRDPFELNFQDYDDHHEKLITVVGVKNERQDDHPEEEEDEPKTNKKRKLALRLDCDAVINAWGNDKSPWITGERPDFDPDDEAWPHSMVIFSLPEKLHMG